MSVAVAITGLLLGPAMAEIVGPYAVIIVAATCGAAWSLSRRETSTRRSALLFFARINATAALITVGLATLTHQAFGLEGVNWLLAPVAMLVGGVGDDWPDVGRWVINRLGRLIERRAGIDGGPQP